MSMNSSNLRNLTTPKIIQISNLKNEETQEEESKRITNKNRKRGKYNKKFLLKSPIYFLRIAFNRIFKNIKNYSKLSKAKKETKKNKLSQFKKQRN